MLVYQTLGSVMKQTAFFPVKGGVFEVRMEKPVISLLLEPF